jgi:hypothetical protein
MTNNNVNRYDCKRIASAASEVPVGTTFIKKFLQICRPYGTVDTIILTRGYRYFGDIKLYEMHSMLHVFQRKIFETLR